jgi:hypothetical protein
MNPAILLMAAGLVVTGATSAFAESRQVFAACIDQKTEDAQASRISPALFNQSFEKSCKIEELLLINELSVKTLTNLPEIKELNARARKRSEQYVFDRRALQQKLYADWYALPR